MFLDMGSSTAIAEKIGNEKYFNLLKDVFFISPIQFSTMKEKFINMLEMKL